MNLYIMYIMYSCKLNKHITCLPYQIPIMFLTKPSLQKNKNKRKKEKKKKLNYKLILVSLSHGPFSLERIGHPSKPPPWKKKAKTNPNSLFSSKSINCLFVHFILPNNV